MKEFLRHLACLLSLIVSSGKALICSIVVPATFIKVTNLHLSFSTNMILGHGANTMTMEEAKAKLCAQAKYVINWLKLRTQSAMLLPHIYIYFSLFFPLGFWVETAMQNSCNITFSEGLKMKPGFNSQKMLSSM